jgi:DNA-binding beta-propeller fold protein YncE
MKRNQFGFLFLTLLVIGGLFAGLQRSNIVPVSAQTAATPETQYQGKITAPEFPFGAEWINVDEPLSITQLRGKVVLLDFWTYGCINCIHIIPDLKRLEAEFPDTFVVIGVHSAKFVNESKGANIREIVQRYEVTHPVVNDDDFQIWTQYGINAWPTTVLIDPAGKILGSYAGEGVYEVMQPVISAMVRQFDARGAIVRTPIKTNPELAHRKPSPLAFPGKVLADAPGKRLFISDSNHNRIIVADLATYEVEAIIGSGAVGLQDGPFTAASFWRPQGMALAGNTLYVADTENHSIRAADLTAGTVTTVAGTGEQMRVRSSSGGPALKTALSSPWDVTAVQDRLYIAMAGVHQIWVLDLKAGTVAPYAGSGREGLNDAPLAQATLAQPSGIVSDGKLLYFTDPEASAVRIAELDPAGSVRTLVGTGLFDFGDVDGRAETVRLQHALGVTLGAQGVLYVADTYNHKIKQIDPAERRSRTLFGKTESGLRDGNDPLFNEPGGLSYANGRLYIADTNNNAIRVADLANGIVATVQFPNSDVLTIGATDDGREMIRLPPQTVAPGETQIVVTISVPPAFRLNDTAPFALHLSFDNPNGLIPAEKADIEILQPTMPIKVPVTLKEGSAILTGQADVYYCDAVNERLCYVSRLELTLPLTIAPQGTTAVALNYAVSPPAAPNSVFKP